MKIKRIWKRSYLKQVLLLGLLCFLYRNFSEKIEIWRCFLFFPTMYYLQGFLLYKIIQVRDIIAITTIYHILQANFNTVIMNCNSMSLIQQGTVHITTYCVLPFCSGSKLSWKFCTPCPLGAQSTKIKVINECSEIGCLPMDSASIY